MYGAAWRATLQYVADADASALEQAEDYTAALCRAKDHADGPVVVSWTLARGRRVLRKGRACYATLAAR